MNASRSLLSRAWSAAGILALLALVLLTSVPAESPVAAQSAGEAGQEELDVNRQRLERYRATEPEVYARLRHDLQHFLRLPAEKQAQLRQLDREIHEEGSSAAFRLVQALTRYVDWLEHLPPAERQEIERAPREERIALIRKRREQEWIARLPVAHRERIQQASDKNRAAVIAGVRKEEREYRANWRVAIRFWDTLVVKNDSLPMRVDDLPLPVMRTFVTDVLLPKLTPEELKRLREAEGHWPDYPRTLVQLADRHPIQLPGPPSGPRTFSELPTDLQSRLPAGFRKKPPAAVRDAEGKWPDYLIALAEYAETNLGKKGEKIILPPKYCPSKPNDFQPALKNFIDKRLFPRLTTEEQRRLVGAEGQWPRYPRLLLELARQKNLEVPGMSLPGPRGWWDKYRTSAIPELDTPPGFPERWFKQFALQELARREHLDWQTP